MAGEAHCIIQSSINQSRGSEISLRGLDCIDVYHIVFGINFRLSGTYLSDAICDNAPSVDTHPSSSAKKECQPTQYIEVIVNLALNDPGIHHAAVTL